MRRTERIFVVAPYPCWPSHTYKMHFAGIMCLLLLMPSQLCMFKHMIAVNLCFLIRNAHMRGTLEKCRAELDYCLILCALFKKWPHCTLFRLRRLQKNMDFLKNKENCQYWRKCWLGRKLEHYFEENLPSEIPLCHWTCSLGGILHVVICLQVSAYQPCHKKLSRMQNAL
jgi:hypothetical protein